MLTENIRIRSLVGKISRIYFHRHFKHVCRLARYCFDLGFRNFNIGMILQDVVDRVVNLIRNLRVIEDYDI